MNYVSVSRAIRCTEGSSSICLSSLLLPQSYSPSLRIPPLAISSTLQTTHLPSMQFLSLLLSPKGTQSSAISTCPKVAHPPSPFLTSLLPSPKLLIAPLYHLCLFFSLLFFSSSHSGGHIKPSSLVIHVSLCSLLSCFQIHLSPIYTISANPQHYSPLSIPGKKNPSLIHTRSVYCTTNTANSPSLAISPISPTLLIPHLLPSHPTPYPQLLIPHHLPSYLMSSTLTPPPPSPPPPPYLSISPHFSYPQHYSLPISCHLTSLLLSSTLLTPHLLPSHIDYPILNTINPPSPCHILHRFSYHQLFIPHPLPSLYLLSFPTPKVDLS